MIYTNKLQVIADYKQMMAERRLQGWITDFDLNTNRYYRLAYLAVIRHISQHGYGFLSLQSAGYRYLVSKYIGL